MARAIPRPTVPIGLSVNVSPAELITTDFVDTVRRTLQRTGLDGRHLTLEITEKALVRDTEQALATLRGLKDIGVKVAIDDFGTGYSSFAQLKSLPVDELKIDRGFVARSRDTTPTTWPSSGRSSAWPIRSASRPSPKEWKPRWPRPP